MSDTKQNLTAELIQGSQELDKELKDFQKINQRAHFIALCAAIEGARMKSRLPTFSIVANQIAAQSAINSKLSDDLDSLLQRIREGVLETVSVRNYELSNDLIDKLDRNLFERNCDVQAWITFEEIVLALLEPNDVNLNTAQSILSKLVSTYCVYADSLLMDTTGKVILAAKRTDLVGRDMSRNAWFAPTLAGTVTVTDVYFANYLDSVTINYCAPVSGPDGSVVGVLANYFDWKFALEMISSAGYSESTKANIINKTADVIASQQEGQILKDNFFWLRSGEQAAASGCGFGLEYARNGESLAVGFCHTKGYNAYRGKGWSAVISEYIGNIDLPIRTNVVEKRNEAPSGIRSKEIESEKSGSKLVSTMREVDSLVQSINTNTREVKFLAVNAAIQAGLAGQEGEGFSIISNEVASFSKSCLNFVESVNRTTSLMRKAVEDSSYVRLVDAANDTMSKIDRNLFERYCDIQAWSAFSKCIQMLESGKKSDAEGLELFAKIHKIYEVYHDIYVVDITGTVVCTAVNHNLIGINYAQKDWFKAASNGQIFVSDIYNSEITKHPTVTFSAPILNANNQCIGVIASKFNCQFVTDILGAALIDSNSSVYLLNHNGQIISCRAIDGNDTFLSNFSGFSKIKNLHASGTGHAEDDSQKGKPPMSMGFAYSKPYNTYSGQKWVTIVQKPSRHGDGLSQASPEEKFIELMRRSSSKQKKTA